MKKYFLLLFAFISIVSFSSCEKDDDENENDNYSEYVSLESTNLSASVIDLINQYIVSNHQNATIVEVEIETQYIEVELNNKIELKFNLDGSFLRYGD
jgi:hypothetical protein